MYKLTLWLNFFMPVVDFWLILNQQKEIKSTNTAPPTLRSSPCFLPPSEIFQRSAGADTANPSGTPWKISSKAGEDVVNEWNGPILPKSKFLMLILFRQFTRENY